jgi:CheY-like chemotaxis protein
VWRGSGVALVADDEDIVREVTQTMLEELGFRVVAVTNGQEAVDACAREPGRFTIVLLDLTMPVLNGADALRAIRAIAPGTRVVMMSGFNELETSERFVGVSPDGFIHKPFALANLRERLQSVLNA